MLVLQIYVLTLNLSLLFAIIVSFYGNNKLIIDGSSFKGEAEDDLLVGTWWNHEIIKFSKQISPISGRVIKQKVRFLGKKDEVLTMFDEKFYRMWEFYLAGCEMAFKWGDQVVYQFQLTKNYTSTPVTRDYIYQ